MRTLRAIITASAMPIKPGQPGTPAKSASLDVARVLFTNCTEYLLKRGNYKMKLYGNYFYGNEISAYGQENGFLDYGTLAKSFDAVLNNGIMNATCEIGYWEQESGWAEDESGDYYEPDVYQTYIVSDQGAEILKEINEIVWYNSELDMYVWGVTHYGTSWSYVLTDVPCNCGESAYQN